MNLGSMLLAFAVTYTHFDPQVPNLATLVLVRILSLPLYAINKVVVVLSSQSIMQEPILMFGILWITYFFVACKMSFILQIKNYDTTELRNWYQSRR